MFDRYGSLYALGVFTALLGPASLQAAPPRHHGIGELRIFSPGVDEAPDGQDRPAILFTEPQPGIGIEIETPPIVHVHTNYYNGDKQFQGPLGHGGPAIIVCRHPRTGKRLYLDADLPSGLPTITHTQRGIDYDYAQRKVQIRFSKWNKDKVTIVYKNGDGTPSQQQAVSAPSEFGSAIKERFEQTVYAAAGAVSTVESAAAKGLGKINELTSNLPGVKTLVSAAKKDMEGRRLEGLKQEGEKRARQATRFFPTIR